MASYLLRVFAISWLSFLLLSTGIIIAASQIHSSSSIRFWAQQSGDTHIYAYDFQTDVLTRESSLSANHMIAPDGQRILIPTLQGDTLQLEIMDRRTGHTTPLGTYPIQPRGIALVGTSSIFVNWSIDGERIFALQRNNAFTELYGISVQHGTLELLAQYPFSLRAAAFSPDYRILVMQNTIQTESLAIDLQTQQAYDLPDVEAVYWSPRHPVHGVRMAYVTRLISTRNLPDLMIFNEDNTLDVYSPEVLGGNALPNLAWSPDGTQIAFAISRSREAIRILDLASGQLAHTYNSTENGVLSWSPDGRYLLLPTSDNFRFGGSVNFRLATLEIASGTLHPLQSDRTFSNWTSFHWSPDGQSLLMDNSPGGYLGTRDLLLFDPATGQLRDRVHLPMPDFLPAVRRNGQPMPVAWYEPSW